MSKAMAFSCPLYLVFFNSINFTRYWLRVWSSWTVISFNVGEFSPLELPLGLSYPMVRFHYMISKPDLSMKLCESIVSEPDPSMILYLLMLSVDLSRYAIHALDV